MFSEGNQLFGKSTSYYSTCQWKQLLPSHFVILTTSFLSVSGTSLVPGRDLENVNLQLIKKHFNKDSQSPALAIQENGSMNKEF